MKTASAILALVLAQSASAFVPASSLARAGSSISAATSTAEVTENMKAELKKEDAMKYETTVNTEQKFKVVDIDAAALDPKKRVQM